MIHKLISDSPPVKTVISPSWSEYVDLVGNANPLFFRNEKII